MKPTLEKMNRQFVLQEYASRCSNEWQCLDFAPLSISKTCLTDKCLRMKMKPLSPPHAHSQLKMAVPWSYVLFCTLLTQILILDRLLLTSLKIHFLWGCKLFPLKLLGWLQILVKSIFNFLSTDRLQNNVLARQDHGKQMAKNRKLWLVWVLAIFLVWSTNYIILVLSCLV